jgi:hypothetical protein
MGAFGFARTHRQEAADIGNQKTGPFIKTN